MRAIATACACRQGLRYSCRQECLEQLASGVDSSSARTRASESSSFAFTSPFCTSGERIARPPHMPHPQIAVPAKLQRSSSAFQRGDSGVQVVSCFRDSPPHDHRWQYGLSLGLGAVEHVIYDFGGYCGIAYSYVLVGLLHLTKPLFAIAVGCCNSALKDIQAARPKQWNVGEDVSQWREWMIEMRHLTRIWDAVQKANNSALSRWFCWKNACEASMNPGDLSAKISYAQSNSM